MTPIVPRLLDLFCGAGGAAMGYHRAGFEVFGVDIVRQPEYPFEFHLADAMTFDLAGFDAVHASPPCKAFTPAGNSTRTNLRLFDPHSDLLTQTLERFAVLTVPWVVENVTDAPMPAGSVIYCGSSFGLAVRRHRLFASNVSLAAPACAHPQEPRFQSLDWKARKAGRLSTVVSVHGHLQGGEDTLRLRQWAMGIDWMSNETLTQAIPPAFTESVGWQLLAYAEGASHADVLRALHDMPGTPSRSAADVASLLRTSHTPASPASPSPSLNHVESGGVGLEGSVGSKGEFVPNSLGGGAGDLSVDALEPGEVGGCSGFGVGHTKTKPQTTADVNHKRAQETQQEP